jgi:hypothetical protein
MCTRVRVTATTVPAFRRSDVAIDLPLGLTHGQSLVLVRAILAGLGAKQPDLGAVCWCGERVQVSDPARQYKVEMRHGA